MPLNNTQGSASLGRDCTIVLVHPTFGRIDLPNITGFSARQVTQNIRVDRLDGVQLNGELPKGWQGTIDCERGNAVLEDAFATIEDQWLSGGDYFVCTMFQYTREPSGAERAWVYDNVAIKLDDAGDWRPDAVVKQRLSWEANRRRAV